MTQIEVKQKTDHEITIDVSGEDLSTATVRFIVADSLRDTPFAILTAGAGVDMSNADSGIVVVNLSDEITNRRGTYYYECEVVGAAGNRSVVAQGSLKINATSTGY